MKISKIIAIFMILIIISMPVYASEIISYKISGQDGVNQAVRPNDVLNVEAIVSIDGDPQITSDQIWLGTNVKFDSCVEDINGFLCKLEFTSPRQFRQEEPFSINLHKDDHSDPPTQFSLIDSRSGYFVVDTMPPRIDFDQTTLKSKDNLTVSFQIYDDSYRQGENDVCAGIKTIHFHDDTIDEVIDYDMNQCQLTDSVTMEAPEGSYNLNVDLTDHMGNTASTQINVQLDKSGPTFQDIKFIKGQREINHIGNGFLDVNLIAQVSEDAQIDTIKADLSTLNDKSDYSSLQPDECYEEEGLRCLWDIKIAKTAYGSKQLIFEAQDDIGNYNKQTITKALQRDIDGPRVLDIKTDTQVSDRDYLRRENNTIIAIFSESGAGLDPEDVKLDLSDLGGPSGLKADDCEQGWRCYWHDLDFALADGSYSIDISRDTKDRLGNRLKEPYSEEIILDSSPPQLIDIGINSVGGGLINYEGVATYGDSFEIKARLHEPGMIKDAYGDFSIAISDAHAVQADDCNDLGDGEWECTWITDAIDREAYVNDNIYLTFSDYLGNKAQFEKQVTVYAIEDSYTDYWTGSVECSPSRIDREVTSLVEQKVYCHVNLRGNADIVSISMDECTGESAKYVRKEELSNAMGTDPYVKLTLHAADIDKDTLDLKCPLIITSRTDQTVTSIPEIEEVKINVPFYNLPLGEYGKNVEEKIDDAIDDANGGIWEVVTALNKIVHYAERICSLLTTINNIASVFNLIGSYERITGDILKSNPVTAGAGQALEVSGQSKQSITSVINQNMKTQFIGSDDPSKGFVNKFCKFISCRLFYDEMWEGEITNSIGGWQRKVLKTANSIATGGGAKIPIVNMQFGGQGVNAYTYEKGVEERGSASADKILQGGKLNPKDSLVLSVLTLCIPGIVYNLDKYRQIKCMYADCLKTSVETGVPIKACEDMKEYETCKYVYGELFQLLPFTGLIDYFVDLVKGALSSPFGVVDLVMGYVCSQPITTPGAAGTAKICLLNEVAGMIADIWSDISNIKDDWEIKMDYCSRVEPEEDEDEDEKGRQKGGLF